jgi:hypothetical protein
MPVKEVDMTDPPGGAMLRLTFTALPRLSGVRKRLEPAMIIATLAVFGGFHRRLKRALEGA